MFQQANSESIYEGEARYENNQVRIGGVPATPPRNDPKINQGDIKMHVDNLKTQMSDVAKFLKKTRRLNALGFVIVLVIVISLFITLVALQFTNGAKATSAGGGVDNQSQTEVKTTQAKSCNDLKQKQIHANGIYSIKPEDDFHQIEAFCDMETDGGGWTLVASIHENDIGKKCDAEDRWSEYIPIDRVAVEGKTNWENKLVFGDVRQCTQNDYKNSAYYAMNANDIMIWHVPTQTPTITMKSRAKLRYRTTNHFLQKAGGNLKSLFDEHYPLKVKFGKFIGEKRNDMIMEALAKKSAAIRTILPDWYTYDYGTINTNRITDDTLYHSDGNMMYFGTSSRLTGSLKYEQTYKFTQPTFVVSTKKSQPFLLVAAISNKDGTSMHFRIRVNNYRKQPQSVEILRNNITRDDITLQYRAMHFSNPNDPTVCEFHFIAFSTKKWRSIPPSSFERSYEYNSGKYHYNQFQADGTPSNVVMGYMLLTRSKGNNVTTAQADEIANIILQVMSSLQDLFNEKNDGRGLVVPVTFDRGSTSAVLETIPPSLQRFVEPGYLHFAANNETGYPNAMCPGIKMNIKAPEYGCIGGISDDLRDDGTCGDFAGWAGEKTDVIQQNEPSGLAHSQNDISSAILIFYR